MARFTKSVLLFGLGWLAAITLSDVQGKVILQEGQKATVRCKKSPSPQAPKTTKERWQQTKRLLKETRDIWWTEDTVNDLTDAVGMK